MEAPTAVSKFPIPPNFGEPRLDSVGKTYIVVLTAWTAAISTGMYVFLKNRHLQFIQLRKVPLCLVALCLLHLQLSFDMLMYPMNGAMPCWLEYWIMHICLPLGIAAFQTNNWVLFSRAWGQQHLLWLHSKNPYGKDELGGAAVKDQNWLQRQWFKWCRMCILDKMYWIVGVGIAIQFFISSVIFLISRRFHPSFGTVGPTDTDITKFECRGGWEWLPSGVWQATWTYGFGPFILFKIRKIRDTHYWRLQTSLAILFSLPALPLWLSTWWMPQFYVVNSYWPPNLWFVPGLAAMEFIILVFPLIEIYSWRQILRRAREEPRTTKFSKYSMAALEQALLTDIDRLEVFSATKDLTGENVVFLRRVEAWHQRWKLAESGQCPPGMEYTLKTELWEEAECIWRKLINRYTAEFPINIDDDIYRQLERVFEGVVISIRSNANQREYIVPFADDFVFNTTGKARNEPPQYEEDTPPQRPTRTPPGVGFSGKVFERAFNAVKLMVLENTWIRYVDQLPDYERCKIGVENTISPPINSRWSWRSWVWKKSHGDGGGGKWGITA